MLIILFIDILIGMMAVHMVKNSKGGYTKRNEYINEHCQEPILIMGSSRAMHHYVPNIIKEKTGLNAYNCGYDGNGIILAYMQLRNILNRGHRPQLIIYDLYDRFDFLAAEDNTKALGWERPYYDNPGIDSVFWDLDGSERLKMMSNSYRYNSAIIQIIKDYLKSNKIDQQGFIPLYGQITTDFAAKGYETAPADSMKISYFSKFIQLCQANDINLAIVISPYLHKYQTTRFIKPVKKLFDNHDIKVYDHLADSTFVGKKKLFDDPGHMNEKGASKFTQIIIDELSKDYYFLNNKAK